MTNPTISPRLPDAQGAALGLLSTAALAVAYLAFTALGAFAPALLAAPIQAGGAVTWAFASGLGVIALGFVLTVAYAVAANQQEASLAGRARLAAEGAAQ